MTCPDKMLFVQGMGKMLYEPFRFTMQDFNRTPTLKTVAVFLWTSVVGYFRSEFTNLGLAYIHTGIFLLTLLSLMATEYLMTYSKTDRLFERRYVSDLINLAMYITLPVVLMFYFWFPIYDRLPCMMKNVVLGGVEVEDWKLTTWVVFSASLFLSALYGMVQGLKKPYKFRRRNKYSSPEAHTPITRSMTKQLKR